MSRRSSLLPLLLLSVLWGCSEGRSPPVHLGNPARGRIIVGREACGSCHQIPGMMWADGRAAPPLQHLARRTVVAGVLPNTPDTLTRWVRFPQEVVPGNAMPDMGLSEREARDVAAYLETLR